MSIKLKVKYRLDESDHIEVFDIPDEVIDMVDNSKLDNFFVNIAKIYARKMKSLEYRCDNDYDECMSTKYETTPLKIRLINAIKQSNTPWIGHNCDTCGGFVRFTFLNGEMNISRCYCESNQDFSIDHDDLLQIYINPLNGFVNRVSDFVEKMGC